MNEKDVRTEISPELAEELKSAQELNDNAAAAGTPPWKRQGTNITVSGGKWYWKDGCSNTWWTYPNQLDFKPIGQCPTGQLFEIWPR